MKANILGIDGTKKESIELPSVFETTYNPNLINRAVLAMQSAKKQPKGANPRAGKNTTAIYVGSRKAPTPMRSINVERARLPRLKNRRQLIAGRVAKVPHAVGGMSAHPPKAWKKYWENINKKERRLALKSAIAATASKALVEKRFIFAGELPLIVEDKMESITRTKELIGIFSKIGVVNDVENAKSKIRERAGKGKKRGRRFKGKKSLLIVTAKNDRVLKAARNMPGVEAVTINSLNAELLAPGGVAGRLVVWTEGAINALGEGKKSPTTKRVSAKETKIVFGDWRKNRKAKRNIAEAKTKELKKSNPKSEEEE